MLSLKLTVLDIFLSPLENYLKRKNGLVGILKYRGEFINRIISIFCLSRIIYLSLTRFDNKDLISFMVDYFVYDIAWICSDLKRLKYNYIFVIHHIFTLGMCYIGHDQGFGNGVFTLFEITSPLLHISKITQTILPKYYPFVKTFTKKSYYLFRIICPPFWILLKLLTVYNGTLKHTLILSGIAALWRASAAWHKKM
jgi:hypothetical protein